MARASISFHDLHPTADDLAADVLHGFSQPQKAIPPKYFYDAEGSRLFDAITEYDTTVIVFRANFQGPFSINQARGQAGAICPTESHGTFKKSRLDS